MLKCCIIIFFCVIPLLNSLYSLFQEKFKKGKFNYRREQIIDNKEKINDVCVFPSGKIIFITNGYIKILNNNNYGLLQIIYLSFSTSIDINFHFQHLLI